MKDMFALCACFFLWDPVRPRTDGTGSRNSDDSTYVFGLYTEMTGRFIVAAAVRHNQGYSDGPNRSFSLW